MQQSTVCKNCQQQATGSFCSNCGQATSTHRMNFHFVVHDIQHGLLHFDKGLFYTIKELFTRPGHSIREYVEGKRVKHFKPISMIILLATIYGFLALYFKASVSDVMVMASGGNDKAINTLSKFNNWINSHFVVYSLSMLPFLSISTYLVFKKQGYNFIEHFVLNAFLTGQIMVIQLALFPFTYFYNGTPIAILITGLISTLGFMLMMWGYVQFFNKLTTTKGLVLALMSYLFTLFIFFVFIMVSVFAYFFIYGLK